MASVSLAPLALYYLLRPVVHSDAIALAIGGAVPVGLALASAAERRHSPWAALLIATGLGLALAATVLSGGSSLPLKLYRPLATGVFGLACVVSAAVHRPLLMVLVRALAGRDERVHAALARMDDAGRLQRRLTGLTLIVGIVCLAEAGVTAALAFSLPTGAFLVTSRVIRWAVAGLGVAAALVYRAWVGRGRPHARSRGGAQGKQSWFGPKRHGIGWGPRTWQGRLLTLAVVAAALAAKFAFGLHSLNG
ncbi:VC0807 family protein [Streptomyces sp. bgisy031]|uniref:VC0807 family protein n=1 Tax=Streptomyces sp. bgisy031 TaxID=3413772 RepID=UPI003D753370